MRSWYSDVEPAPSTRACTALIPRPVNERKSPTDPNVRANDISGWEGYETVGSKRTDEVTTNGAVIGNDRNAM